MLFQAFSHTEKANRYVVLTCPKEFCEILNRIGIITANKHYSAFLIERFKKIIYDSRSLICVELIFHRSRRRKAILKLIQRHIKDTVSLYGSMLVILFDRKITHNAANIA